MGTELLRKLAVKLEKKQNTIFTYPVEKQMKYIAHFPEPKDCIESSYFQYCCQMKLYGKIVHTVLNLMAFPASILYKNKFRRSSCESQSVRVDAVFFNDGKPSNIIPQEVTEQYPLLELNPDSCDSLDETDLSFIRGISKRYPISWMFLLKIVLKVAQYSGAIKKYSPKAIISCGEYSFTSSVLTEYCHLHNVKLINVMHGEKLYFMRDSFVHYDEYYVWDEFYAELLKSLRANKEQFRVAIPTSLVAKASKPTEKKYDYTYYLASEPEDILQKIALNMCTLHRKGYRVSVRPHPRYADMEAITKYFTNVTIEDTSKVSIEQSLLQTNAAVSLYSTVLNQAHHSGIEVVVDDISNAASYRKLRELKYIMVNTEHKLLSQIVEKNNENDC